MVDQAPGTSIQNGSGFPTLVSSYVTELNETTSQSPGSRGLDQVQPRAAALSGFRTVLSLILQSDKKQGMSEACNCHWRTVNLHPNIVDSAAAWQCSGTGETEQEQRPDNNRGLK